MLRIFGIVRILKHVSRLTIFDELQMNAADRTDSGEACKPAQLSVMIGAMQQIFFTAHRKISSSRLSGIALLCLAFWSVCTGAAEITGLYDALIPIAARDNERDRRQAYGLALQEVLLKLTGRRDTLDDPEIKRGISNAQTLVESWTYRTAPVVPAAGETVSGGEQLLLQVGFFPSEVQRLLNSARIPIWPQNRPETLMWILVEQELGSRVMFGTTVENNAEIMQQIQAAAAKRGLPLLLPLLDFTDQRALSIEQLRNFDEVAIRQASMRYGNESILAMRIFQSVSGETVTKAQYLFRDQVMELNFIDDSLQPAVDGSVNLVAEQLAGNYAVLLSGTAGSTEVIMTVEGIKGPKDYADLMQYANNMTAVDKVDLVGVANGAVQLRLFTSGQLRQLIEAIAVDRRMSPVIDPTRTGEQVAMHYQWQSRF